MMTRLQAVSKRSFWRRDLIGSGHAVEGHTPMDDHSNREIARRHRGWAIGMAILLMLTVIPRDALSQTSSSSRPVSASVISTYVARDGELTLLVLWRGSPGWYSRGGGSSSRSGGSGGAAGGREFGSFSMTFGGRTLSIDFDYTAHVARLLGQEISLADTNVVLVDDVDGPTGARISSLLWVDPKLPNTDDTTGARNMNDDPAIVAMRRAPQAGAFLQCDIPLTMPNGVDAPEVDPVIRARLTEYMQGLLTEICRAAVRP